MKRPSLLLHCCCAPCTTSVQEQLINDFDITLYFYNPNIRPYDEYIKRAEEMRKIKLLLSDDIKLISDDYNEIDFSPIFDMYPDEPEGGERCLLCFELRLKKTAELAAFGGFNYFATTLSVSPHKDADIINEVGTEVAQSFRDSNLTFLAADFKKQDGFKRSIELSKQLGLYRQNYCGCRRSKLR